MQTLETIKTKSQNSLSNLLEKSKEQPDEAKIWAMAASSAVVGALTMTAVAKGAVAVLGAIASPPVALAVGAVGGGVLGWKYTQRYQQDHQQEHEHEQNRTSDAIHEQAFVAADDVQGIGPADTLSTPSSSVEPAPVKPAPVKPTIIEPIPVETVDVAQMGDKLEIIDGIGRVYATRLQSGGIQTFAQLAELTPEQIQELVAPTRTSPMSEIAEWITEARQLAAQ